jgi:L-asparagine oxygenase
MDIHEAAPAVVEVSEEEALQLRRALQGIAYDPSGSAAYVSSVRRAAYAGFPDRLLRIFDSLKSGAYSHLVVENLPIDEHVHGSPRFEQTGAQYKAGVLSENLLVAIGAVIAEPYSIFHEGRELVNNLTPHRHAAREYTGLGSDVELDFHTENAAQAHMPEGDTSPLALLLLGIRGEPGGTGPLTRVADARAALRLLDAQDIASLRGNNFVIRVPYRWRGSAPRPRDNTDLRPLVTGPAEAPRITAAFYPDMVLPVNQAARTALDSFYRAIKQVCVGIDISPGRLVIINNLFTLHSRDRFSPRYDENDCAYRWLQRIFVAPTLWNFRAFRHRGERVFDPSDLYAETLPAQLVHA